jgi:transcriptional regulator with XRE-family HTH domain
MRDATTQQEINALGAAVRTVREQQGMSQTDLSEASGLHRTHVSQIERGLCVPRFETLMKLRRGLGSLAEVFALIEDEVDQWPASLQNATWGGGSLVSDEYH